jgi:hypothetical protein
MAAALRIRSTGGKKNSKPRLQLRWTGHLDSVTVERNRHAQI